MAIKITRKNNGLNNAMRGAHQGLLQGMALGMQARQNAAQEENRKQLTALAVQQAKQVSDQIDRELAQNQAATEAVGVQAQDYANDPTAPLNAGMKAGPGVAAAVGMAQQDKWGKLGEIAKRMKPEAAKLMLLEAKSRETQAIKERGLAGFRDKIARITSEGADKSDPEARPWMDPATVAEGDAEYANGLKNLSMMAADPNSDPVVLDQQLGELIKKRAKSEGAAHGRANQFQGFTDQANNTMAAAGGSFAPEQGRAIRTMMSTFRQAPWIYDDPKAMQAFQAKFQDALQGYTTVGNERVKFEDEQIVRNGKMREQDLTNRLLQLRAETEAARKAGIEADTAAIGKPRAQNPTDNTDTIAKLEIAASDPMLDPADKQRILSRIKSLEGGGGNVPEPGAAMIQDVKARTGMGAQNSVVPPPGKVRTPQDAAAQVRALMATGATTEELEALAEKLAREIQNAGG